jgi:para-nitrobenzyl esterase
MNRLYNCEVICMALIVGASAAAGAGIDRVKIANGELEGAAPKANGVRTFKGVPFAAPPLGELRFALPQPVKNWTGVRDAKEFGPRCMQQSLYGDMNFRSNGMSEDCLYLNVWTPAKTGKEKLPVLVYFYGGGFAAGDGSEPRYDGESMAAKGIVSLTVNYRLGVFGFFVHPDLTKASGRNAAGNWALLDQNAALRWVRENIAVFGGDPQRVTIAGESAGSVAVSAHMASPLSKDLIAGAIGESGSILGTLPAVPLAEAEERGAKFLTAVGVKGVAALRAMPADQLLAAASKQGMPQFSTVVDGYFLPEPPAATFAAGKQANVPLMAGWNSEEMGAFVVLRRDQPTKENFEKAIDRLYGPDAKAVLAQWTPTTGEDVNAVATELATARFIAYSTWKWIDECATTGHKPVYRYYYSRPRPAMRPEMGNATAGLAGGVIRGAGTAPAMPPPSGAVHSAEIEYAMGNLATNNVYAWTPDDHKVSQTMQEYFANFIKTGNPNGGKLANWPAVKPGQPANYLHIDVETKAETEAHRGRYTVLSGVTSR